MPKLGPRKKLSKYLASIRPKTIASIIEAKQDDSPPAYIAPEDESELAKPQPATVTMAVPAPVALPEVMEITVVCIDVSGSMQTPFENGRDRLEAVKQMFYGFRDQTSMHAHGSRHKLGLLSYDTTVQLHTLPTDNFQVCVCGVCVCYTPSHPRTT
jgi:hypothetical protein